MDAAALIAVISAEVPDAGVEDGQGVDRPSLAVSRDRLPAVCRALRDHPALRFDVLADLTAVDWWPREPRFAIVYHLLSTTNRLRVRLEVTLAGDDAHVPTLRGTWASADWLEREVWDLFGVVFDGHGDLRRLLMPEDWDGHPLRKDYPVQISMKPKVYAPLQVTEEEFHEQIEKDRTVRGGTGLERGRERS